MFDALPASRPDRWTAEQRRAARDRTVEIALGELRAVVGRLDPSSLSGPQAVQLLDVFDEFGRVAAAGRALVAARAAETNQWRGTDRSAAEWLAKRTGTTTGEARKSLETVERAKHLPKTDEALRRGALSLDQAAAVSDGAAADPAAEDELLAAATRESVRELRARAERVKAAALPDDRARHEAIRRRRSAKEYVGDDGAWNLHLRGTKDEGASFMTHARSFIDSEFKKARKEGRREPIEAYAFDGIMAMGTAAAFGTRAPSKSPYKAILRADLAAIRRGSTQPGEVCEIAGYGPVPVGVAREILGEAFLAVVLTDGHDVLNVTHLGRAPTAYQQTALEWAQPECEVLGCATHIRLERDHRVDWAKTRHTRLDELDRLCHFHHSLKTVLGWQLEPGRGKRRMLSPEQLVDAVARPP